MYKLCIIMSELLATIRELVEVLKQMNEPKRRGTTK